MKKGFSCIILIFSFISTISSAQEEFRKELRLLYQNKEYVTVLHEAQEYINSLPSQFSDIRTGAEESGTMIIVRGIIMDVLCFCDNDDLYKQCVDLLKDLCTKRCFIDPKVMGLFSILENIETLVGLGFHEEACKLLEEIDLYKDDTMNMEYYLNNNEIDKPQDEFHIRHVAQGIYPLFIWSILPLFCDKKNNCTDRINAIVTLINPYKEEPWMPQVIENFTHSPIWGDACRSKPSEATKEYYSFLCDVEPIMREQSDPKNDAWMQGFYSKLVHITEVLERYEDLVKWWNIRLALADSPSRADVARIFLSDAQKKLRKQQGKPRLHEKDIKKMEEVGLIE